MLLFSADLNIRKHFICLLTLFLFHLLIPSILMAEGAGYIKLWNWEIHPNFTVSETYNSNIFSEANRDGESPDQDWITDIVPGMEIKYPGRNLEITLSTFAEIERYERFTTEDTEKVDGLFELQYTSPSKDNVFAVDYHYLDTYSAPSSDVQSNSRLFRMDRIQKTLTGSIERKFSKELRLILDASRDTNAYDGKNLDTENTNKNSFGGSVYYKFWPKTSVTMNYHYETADYPDARRSVNSDSRSQIVRVGFASEPTAQLSGEATIGYERTRYDKSGFKDGNGVSIDANLLWKFRARTSLGVMLSRSQEDSSFGFGANSSYYTTTTLGLSLTELIGSKVNVTLDGNYQTSDYPEFTGGAGNKVKRDDERLNFALDIRYDMFDWLALVANYDYTKNDSEVNAMDYSINECLFKIEAFY